MSELPEDFKRLLVRPLEIYSGETGMVVLCKLRRKMDTLIKQHNKVVERMAQELTSRGGNTREKGKTFPISDEKAMPSGELQSLERCSPPSELCLCVPRGTMDCPVHGEKSKWLNRPRDVVDLLIQMRYTCQCVAPVVTWLELTTYRFLWCKDCNRPYLEKED
jgi:hypothetical protein